MCENEKLWIGVNVDSQSVLTANHRQTARCMKHSGNVLQKDWQHALKGTVMDYPPPYTHTHTISLTLLSSSILLMSSGLLEEFSK